MKRIVLLVAMLAMVALLAAPALAQGKPEDVPRGQVERGPEHANSICSFSGLNDFDEEEEPPYDTQVQSYGQLVKQGYKGTEFAPPPGLVCNGHLFPYPEAFGPEPE